MPGVEKLANTHLELKQWAPALVGWDTQLGRNIPQFDEIIVAVSVVLLLQEAHAAMEEEQVRKRAMARHRLAKKRWNAIVMKYLLRQRLQRDFGPY